jgi:hypothetical protein
MPLKKEANRHPEGPNRSISDLEQGKKFAETAISTESIADHISGRPNVK